MRVEVGLLPRGRLGQTSLPLSIRRWRSSTMADPTGQPGLTADRPSGLATGMKRARPFDWQGPLSAAVRENAATL
jgi:hypothetical protein